MIQSNISLHRYLVKVPKVSISIMSVSGKGRCDIVFCRSVPSFARRNIMPFTAYRDISYRNCDDILNRHCRTPNFTTCYSLDPQTPLVSPLEMTSPPRKKGLSLAASASHLEQKVDTLPPCRRGRLQGQQCLKCSLTSMSMKSTLQC